MSESGVGTCPQVFVVDSQASYINSMPPERKPRWASQLQKYLLLLVGLAMLGLIVEGFLIYNLYQKTKDLPLSGPPPHYQNLSNPKAESQVGYRDSNEIPPVQTQTEQRAFAHLLGSSEPIGENDVVQWVNQGDAVTLNMNYDKGRLIVKKEGYYYLYSKVQMNAADECVLIQHRMVRKTKAYGKPIPLMQSKSHRCSTSKPVRSKPPETEDLWNSYLAGIFQLQVGDEIYVTLKNIQKIRPGPTENFMGAFMISP